MKKIAIAILAISLTAVSCGKDNNDNNSGGVNNDPSSFDEMNVANNFDWNTTKTVTIDIEGLSLMTDPIKRIMKVSDPNGKLLSKKVVEMGQNSTLEFVAAASLEEVTIEYGTISKTVELTNGRGDFSFIPEDDRSDLDPEDR